ncbi:MAG TPA: aminodeoxychorismate synthase component I [Gemmataceae bacterium]|jgi:para-aminobenzoate synthetase component 1|nr:aminodeoxychorismate synthase component I [Gemmataceae bacterium]
MVVPTGNISLLNRPASSSEPFTSLVEELPLRHPGTDPWELAQRLAALPHFLFMDSALKHPHLGRYSFITADPFQWISSRGSRTVISGEGRVVEEINPFAVLAESIRRYQSESIPGLPPFQGGAAGLFGYDLCHHLERLPRPKFDEFQTPDLAVGLYDWTLAFDLVDNRAWLISTGFPETEPRRRRARAVRRLAEVKKYLRDGDAAGTSRGSPFQEKLAVQDLAPQFPVADIPGLLSNFNRETYLQTVRRIIDYIQAGDCYQVNLAQRLLRPATVEPLELYGRLRERNPATFAAYFNLGDVIIASSSPERFLRVENNAVETRPIKGTRPRGQTPPEDRARIQELLASAKDRAENVMIVDLLRNDLGRVCRYYSVRVPAVCRVETYPFVHHLVSEVRGQLREGLTPLDLLRAAFPGGSVTGAPKIRAMEIIAELEPSARGPYCGSLGYIGFDGTMDTNILIRTFTAGRGWFQFPVGGGIVADSLPEHEYQETWQKAQGLLRALSC